MRARIRVVVAKPGLDGHDRGAKVVARAWVDSAFRARLLADGRAACEEFGISFYDDTRLIALENTNAVHNLIVCTLCSCYPRPVLGLPPDWYKDFDYRARVVRESRTVLKEMGLDLPPEVEIRVWDTTADTRYVVLPLRPPGLHIMRSQAASRKRLSTTRLPPPTRPCGWSRPAGSGTCTWRSTRTRTSGTTGCGTSGRSRARTCSGTSAVPRTSTRG